MSTPTDGAATVTEPRTGQASATDSRDGHAVAGAGLTESVPAPARDVSEGKSSSS